MKVSVAEECETCQTACLKPGETFWYDEKIHMALATHRLLTGIPNVVYAVEVESGSLVYFSDDLAVFLEPTVCVKESRA